MALRVWLINLVILICVSLAGCSSFSKDPVQESGCWYIHDGKPTSIGMLCKCDSADQDFLLKGDGAVITATSSFDIYEDHLDLVHRGNFVDRVDLTKEDGFLIGDYNGNKITIRRLDVSCRNVYSDYSSDTKMTWTNAVLAVDSLRKLRL